MNDTPVFCMGCQDQEVVEYKGKKAKLCSACFLSAIADFIGEYDTSITPEEHDEADDTK